MQGYILLADGMRLDGTLVGSPKTVIGWLAANTAVVGFQEMASDPTYKGRILAFTYPEVGNVGTARAFSESSRLQVAGLVVKVLSQYTSHYLSEDSLENTLVREDVPCLSGIDTRGLAVHMREEGEMAAAIAPADAAPEEVKEILASFERPGFQPSDELTVPVGDSDLKVVVIDLGVRQSQLRQLSRCCRPEVLPHDAGAEAITAGKPAGVFVSDGPGGSVPPRETIETVKALLGKVPILACGLGHVALGMALGCEPTFLKRGHHGVNYPVRNTADGAAEVTAQRHTVVLERESVAGSPDAELLWENINDGTVEGIRSADGSAAGFQSILAAPQAGQVNAHMKQFVEGLRGN